VKVIAGDDVTKVVADHAGEIRDLRRVEVYYSALATREMRRDSPTPPTAFVYSLLGGKYPNASEDNLILTYDAAGVFCQAANTAYRSGGLPSKGDILYELARTSAGSAWNGSSGVVDFAGTERHDPVDKSIAIMRMGETGPAVPIVRCGQLDIEEEPSADPLCANLPDAPTG
jgi:hypothetical protein